jgi:hypothetical protein
MPLMIAVPTAAPSLGAVPQPAPVDLLQQIEQIQTVLAYVQAQVTQLAQNLRQEASLHQ